MSHSFPISQLNLELLKSLVQQSFREKKTVMVCLKQKEGGASRWSYAMHQRDWSTSIEGHEIFFDEDYRTHGLKFMLKDKLIYTGNNNYEFESICCLNHDGTLKFSIMATTAAVLSDELTNNFLNNQTHL